MLNFGIVLSTIDDEKLPTCRAERQEHTKRRSTHGKETGNERVPVLISHIKPHLASVLVQEKLSTAFCYLPPYGITGTKESTTLREQHLIVTLKSVLWLHPKMKAVSSKPIEMAF